MANVSSFSGELYFRTEGKPWTFEGYLAAYDILMSLDCSDGGYGFAMNDEPSSNSAEFVTYLMTQGTDAYISYWGNGRWSASGTLERFDDWTKYKGHRNEMSEETYLKARDKFVKMMLENKWSLVFEHIDVEGGMDFIVKESCYVFVTDKIKTDKGEESTEPYFTTYCDVYESGHYNLRDYSNLIDYDLRGDAHREVVGHIAELLGVGEDGISDLSDFIIEEDWDELLSPNPSYYWGLEDLPEGLQEAWVKLKNKGEDTRR